MLSLEPWDLARLLKVKHKPLNIGKDYLPNGKAKRHTLKARGRYSGISWFYNNDSAVQNRLCIAGYVVLIEMAGRGALCKEQ
jgi:hypothetical protein